MTITSLSWLTSGRSGIRKKITKVMTRSFQNSKRMQIKRIRVIHISLKNWTLTSSNWKHLFPFLSWLLSRISQIPRWKKFLRHPQWRIYVTQEWSKSFKKYALLNFLVNPLKQFQSGSRNKSKRFKKFPLMKCASLRITPAILTLDKPTGLPHSSTALLH